MSIAELASTTDTRKNFFPTPKVLIDELLSGIDWELLGAVLEPSAGKGDIAIAVIDKLKSWHRRYRYSDDDESFDVDCVEIDADLRSILAGKKLRVVCDDFLSFRTFKRYAAIVMNPPFDRGADHLLKALEMQQRGGYIACILNAETIDNPCTYARKKLVDLLKQYDSSFTYKENAFMDAERPTGVRVVIVKVTIPFQPEEGSSILESMRVDEAKYRMGRTVEQNELAKGDFVDAIVDRFNFEAGAGCKLIREYDALLPYLKDSLDEKSYVSQMLTIRMGHNHEDATENGFIRAVRQKYWSALFNNPQFIRTMTSNLRTELMESVEKLKDYDFSAYNIACIRVNMQKKLTGGIHQTIMKLFDDWTYKYEWRDENSKNRHYYDGWRTNDAFAVNKRVVIPCVQAFGSFDGSFDPNGYRVGNTLSDVEKVFDYLSGNTPDNNAMTLALDVAKRDGHSSGIQLRYFKATFYKKGTCHLEFTDMDVLQKFNLFAARDKKWLPPCYGRKTYKEMDEEEKQVIDSFEGEKSYAHVLSRKEYFLQEVSGSFLTEGETVSAKVCKCSICGIALNDSEPDYDDVCTTNDGFDDEITTCYSCHCGQMDSGEITICESCGMYFTPNHILTNPVNDIQELCPYCGEVWCG